MRRQRSASIVHLLPGYSAGGCRLADCWAPLGLYPPPNAGSLFGPPPLRRDLPYVPILAVVGGDERRRVGGRLLLPAGEAGSRRRPVGTGGPAVWYWRKVRAVGRGC